MNTTKTAIEMVKKYIPNQKRITDLQNLVEYLIDKKEIGVVGSFSYDEKVNTSINLNSQENFLISIHSKIEFLNNQIMELKLENEYIMKLIESLENPEIRSLFKERYIVGMDIDDIIYNECYSQSTYYRLHKRGLEYLDRFFV